MENIKYKKRDGQIMNIYNRLWDRSLKHFLLIFDFGVTVMGCNLILVLWLCVVRLNGTVFLNKNNPNHYF